MIKKLLITLFVIIVLLAGGVTALIMLVDPNNFRTFIADTVKDKTGYELTINGDLRWHIWPQVSILTDAIVLNDSGAKKPILTADNMRLDVELFPLFSKELAIKDVLIKSAVINLTDESNGKVAASKQSSLQPSATINNQSSNTPSKTSNDNAWAFKLNKIEVADSTLIWQQGKQDIISFRNINAKLLQQEKSHINLDLKGTINRDQRDLTFALLADIDMQQYPNKMRIALSNLDYTVAGAGIPTGELSGNMAAIFNYVKSPLSLTSDDFNLSVNNNTFKGTLKAELENKPYFEAILSADKLDITPFISHTGKTNSENGITEPVTRSVPVVATLPPSNNELAFLTTFDAKLKLNANEIIADKLTTTHLTLDATNKEGVATINQLAFDLAKGHIEASGSANGKQATTLVKLNTTIKTLDLGDLFKQLDIVHDFYGQFNASGELALASVQSSRFLSSLSGNLQVIVNNARLENINIQQIIQTTVAQYTNDIATPEMQQKYTEFHELSTNATINSGDMQLQNLKASSATVDMTGDGRVGLVKHDLDVDLAVKILGGWNGKSQTIQKLQQITIPLRIYGEFTNLHYQINVEKLIKDVLSNKLEQELDKLRDRLQRPSSSSEKTTEESSKPNLSDLIDKLKSK